MWGCFILITLKKFDIVYCYFKPVVTEKRVLMVFHSLMKNQNPDFAITTKMCRKNLYRYKNITKYSLLIGYYWYVNYNFIMLLMLGILGAC